MPILLYGSEVWGFEDCSLIETVHLRYMKYLLRLRKTTSSCMVYAETGRYPLQVMIKCRILNFWAKLVSDESNKISGILYKIMLQLHTENKLHSNWVTNVEKTINESGMGNIWASQNIPNINQFKQAFKQRVRDQFKQSCLSSIQNSEKCHNYRLFKYEHDYEMYLNNEELAFTLCRFRLGNNKLPINIIDTDTPRNERYCNICKKNVLGDEFHFLLECTSLKDIRRQFIPERYWKRPNTILFCELMSNDNINIRLKLVKFIRVGLKKIQT